MTHWKKLTDPDYMGAWDIDEGQTLNVVIVSVSQKDVVGQNNKRNKRPIAQLQGYKPFVVNATNAKSISKIAGSPDVEKWHGVCVGLVVREVSAFGDTVEALRVVPPISTKRARQKEILTVDHDKWDSVKSKVESGEYSIDDAKKYFIIDEETEKQLLGWDK